MGSFRARSTSLRLYVSAFHLQREGKRVFWAWARVGPGESISRNLSRNVPCTRRRGLGKGGDGGKFHLGSEAPGRSFASRVGESSKGFLIPHPLPPLFLLTVPALWLLLTCCPPPVLEANPYPDSLRQQLPWSGNRVPNFPLLSFPSYCHSSILSLPPSLLSHWEIPEPAA